MKMPVGRRRHAQVRGDVEVLAHRAAHERHLAVEFDGRVDHLLDAVDVRGEAGDDDAPLAAREDLVERGTDRRLGGHDAWAVGVGRVAAQAEDALGAELGEARDVGRAPVDRGLVEAVVARDQDRAELRVEGDGAGVGDRVRHVNRLDLERPGLGALARLEHDEVGVADLSLLQLRAHEAESQRAAVDRLGNTQLAKHVGHRADVVLVSVGEDHRVDVVLALPERGEVRQDEVDAEHLGRRKHHSRVHDDDPPIAFDGGHVLADLPEPAQRQDLDLAHRPSSAISWSASRAWPGRRGPSAAAASRRSARASKGSP